MANQIVNIFKRIPRRFISLLLLVAILIFIAIYLKGTDFSQLKHLRINWWLVMVGSIWAILFRYWAVFIWRVILRALGSKNLPPFRLMAYVFAKAWMARYIPGTITWIAGRVYMAASYGISRSRLAVSSILEGGMQVASATAVSLLLIGFSRHVTKIPLAARILVVVISLACLSILLPPVFNRILHRAHVFIKKKAPGAELKINSQAMVKSFVLFALGTFINGTACYFIVLAVNPHFDSDLYFYIVGTFGLAGAIGIAVPFLPSGIGVRDGVLLVLLSAVMPKDIALAITIFSRLWQVAVDGVFLGLAAAIYKLLHEKLPKTG